MKKKILIICSILLGIYGIWWSIYRYPRTKIKWIQDYQGTEKYEVKKIPFSQIIRGINTKDEIVLFNSLVDIRGNFIDSISLKTKAQRLSRTASGIWYDVHNDLISTFLLDGNKKPIPYKMIKVNSKHSLDSIYNNAVNFIGVPNSPTYFVQIDSNWYELGFEYNDDFPWGIYQEIKKNYPEKFGKDRLYPLAMETKKPYELVKLFDYDKKYKGQRNFNLLEGGIGRTLHHGVRYNKLYMPDDTLKFRNYGGSSMNEGIHLYTNDSLYYKHHIMYMVIDDKSYIKKKYVKDRYKKGGVYIIRPRKGIE